MTRGTSLTRPAARARSTRRVTAVAVGVPLVAAVLSLAGPAAARADVGRQLVGEFCSNPAALPKPGACLSLAYDGQTALGYTGSPDRVLALRPGTYWLSVRDDSTAHNFSLEGPGGLDQDITGIAETPGWVTAEIHLTHGSYTLFCDADDHRADGMYVDIEVGGVGQVG